MCLKCTLRAFWVFSKLVIFLGLHSHFTIFPICAIAFEFPSLQRQEPRGQEEENESGGGKQGIDPLITWDSPELQKDGLIKMERNCRHNGHPLFPPPWLEAAMRTQLSSTWRPGVIFHSQVPIRCMAAAPETWSGLPSGWRWPMVAARVLGATMRSCFSSKWGKPSVERESQTGARHTFCRATGE
jgi:hypothetical protein